MDKYIKCFKETEEKSRKRENLKLMIMILKLKKELVKYFSKESQEVILKTNYKELLNLILINLNSFNENLQNYIVNNIINNLNKECIINLYLMWLCNSQTREKKDDINTLIDSFKKTGLIKDINYNPDKCVFTLTTLKEKEIKFKSINKSSKEIDEANGQCHGITEFILKENNRQKLYAVTILMNTLMGDKQYHTFVLCNNMVNDFAHNIVMNFDNYKLLYNPTIVSFASAKKAFRDIEKLKEKDSEFNNSNCELLNYAIHKQLRKRKKKSNRN